MLVRNTKTSLVEGETVLRQQTICGVNLIVIDAMVAAAGGEKVISVPENFPSPGDNSIACTLRKT